MVETERGLLASPSGDPSTTFIQLLDLAELDGGPAGEDIFLGPSQQQPRQRVFGGQVVAQSLVAAMRTVDAERLVHSMHGYFLRPGDAIKPITFGVQRLRDGRSFSARRVHAYQEGVPILSMIASFRVLDEGLHHESTMPDVISDRESLPGPANCSASSTTPLHAIGQNGPSTSAMCTRPSNVLPRGEKKARNAVWMKTFGPMPDDSILHRAALAYASDYILLESILRRHRFSWSTPGMSVASPEHAMWWHRPARVDEWLLYIQESPSSQGARGLATGKIFNQAGQHLASVAQEGMVRVPAEPRHLPLR